MNIFLTDREQVLWNAISACFNGPSDGANFRQDGIGQKQRELITSLLKREVIPARRWKWLMDPSFLVGSNKSRWEIFKENSGRSDESAFELPDWGIRYLPFLLGIIDLPEPVIAEFRSDAGKSMTNGYEIGMKYRSVAKNYHLEKRHAEEFFKLALDCDFDPGSCRTIRDIIFKHLRK